MHMSNIPLALYIHFPWCEKKCPYCDFNSHVLDLNASTDLEPELEDAYIDQLLFDLDRDIEDFQIETPISSIFMGGGTPSLVSPQAIARLLEGISQRLSINPKAECTLEANPGSSDQVKFQGYRAAGINRLSLGIQSFSDTKLAALGRVHSGAEALAAVESARQAGFDNINLDLIHGLPGQTAQDALSDLERAHTLFPEHLSWYQLTIEPNTLFFNRTPSLPTESDLDQISTEGWSWLNDHGYGQYEVSAFSRGNHYQSQHNLNYWRFGDYIGLGAGAHGKVTQQQPDFVITRTRKSRIPNDYLKAAKRITKSVEAADLRLEFLMNALRLNEGFLLSDFSQRTGLASSELVDFIASGLAQGLLIKEDQKLRPTQRGLQFLDSLLLLA